MVSIHYAIAGIYERSGHADWAVLERRQGRPAPTTCAARRALCEFLAGRYRPALHAALALSDIESQYWRVRAASELALTAFAQLDTLPDGLERRAIRATRARAEERFTDAVEELKAALKFAPGLPTLVFDLASAYYDARDYEQALATVTPLLEANQNDPRLLALAGNSLLQLRRPAEAIPALQRAAERNPSDTSIRSALGRAPPERRLRGGRSTAGGAVVERSGWQRARAARSRIHGSGEAGGIRDLAPAFAGAPARRRGTPEDGRAEGNHATEVACGALTSL